MFFKFPSFYFGISRNSCTFAAGKNRHKIMIYFFVQARVGSSRLPNKILLPFYNGKNILELLIEKLQQVENTGVIIATSTNPNCDPIEAIAQKKGAICFRGSEDDVLQRFIDAAEKNQVNQLIRVCSDNPFLDLHGLRELVQFVYTSEQPIDYASFHINDTPSILTHYGFWTEYTTLEALLKAKEYAAGDHYYHEHLTSYLYTHPENFHIHWLSVPEVILTHPDIRLTIDTEDDFHTAQAIYKDICATNPYPTLNELIIYLDQHQDMYKMMKLQIEKNSK